MIGFKCLIASGVWCTLKKISWDSKDQAATLQTSWLKPDLLHFFFPPLWPNLMVTLPMEMSPLPWLKQHRENVPSPWLLLTAPEAPASAGSVDKLGLAASGKALLSGWRLCPHCIEFRFKNQWVGSSSLPGERGGPRKSGEKEQRATKTSVHRSASLSDVQLHHCYCTLCFWFSKSISEFMESG